MGDTVLAFKVWQAERNPQGFVSEPCQSPSLWLRARLRGEEEKEAASTSTEGIARVRGFLRPARDSPVHVRTSGIVGDRELPSTPSPSRKRSGLSQVWVIKRTYFACPWW